MRAELGPSGAELGCAVGFFFWGYIILQIPFWTLPTDILPPAVGIGLINGAGNLGGTVGPHFFGAVHTATGSFSLALLAAGLSLILGSLIAIPIAARGNRNAEKQLAD
jgi:hypothetical protein